MRLIAIGDVQGCYSPLRRLLDRLAFTPGTDRLLFTGDLVNRGPESLAALRFIRELGAHAISVLGNHDLHLLAVARGGRARKRDTLEPILAAPDRDELLAWLRGLPLAWADPSGTMLLVHAGVAPQWTIAQSLELAAEVQDVLAGPGADELFTQMYGNEPARWHATLAGPDRWRFVINCMTRMRYCREDGRIDVEHKGPPGAQARGLVPWFAMPGRRSRGTRIVFGHWSTLGRVRWEEENVDCLDSGCIWGGGLTALRLDSGEVVTEGCAEYGSR